MGLSAIRYTEDCPASWEQITYPFAISFHVDTTPKCTPIKEETSKRKDDAFRVSASLQYEIANDGIEKRIAG